jgi:hypothetical protein
MNIIELIKPKNSLLVKQLYSKIFKALFQELSEFDTKKELCRDMEFISLACNLVEHLVDSQKKHLKVLRVDKMKLVVDVFTVIYELNDEEKETLQEHIQFVFDNEMIKKVSTLRYIKKNLSRWISTKL